MTKIGSSEVETKSKNSTCKPFLKWAGGKRQLIPEIKKYIPVNFKRYVEPFVGAGAVLLDLKPENAIINDINPELINCYRVIKESPNELIDLCLEYQSKNSKEFFYFIRELDRKDNFIDLSSVRRAARLIYLNKTCFNGLFRVNKKGQFNVPYGDYKKPNLIDPENISAISTYLNSSRIDIFLSDYQSVLNNCGKGDFIYIDPPYHPVSKTSSFTSYGKDSFAEANQIELKNICDKLSSEGCMLLISNSDTTFIRELFSNSDYSITEVRASRAINSIASKRGKVGELLIHNRYIGYSK